MKKVCALVTSIVVLLVFAGMSQGVELLNEKFSSYTDFSWLGADSLNPGPGGWFLAGPDEGVKSLITNLGAEPVGTAPGGTNTAMMLTFGALSTEKDTNIGWISPSDVFLANTVYTFSFDMAVGVGKTGSFASIFQCGNLAAGETLVTDTTAATKTPSDGWVHVSVVVDTTQTYTYDPLGKSLRIQLNIDGGRSVTPPDTVYLTNVRITAEVMSFNAKDPIPANGSIQPSVSRLAWTPGEQAVKHGVYMGTSLEEVTAATDPTVGPIGLGKIDSNSIAVSTAAGTRYYWRVDEYKADNTLTTALFIWNFETARDTSALVKTVKHHWKLDEASGTVAYDSAGSINGVNNGATIHQAGPTGSDYAYLFGGTAATAVNLSTPALIPEDGDWNVFVTMKTNNPHLPAPGDGQGHLFGNNDAASSLRSALYVNNNGFGFYQNAGPSLSVAKSISDDVWHEVGISREGNLWTLWLDGLSERTTTNAAAVSQLLPWAIGNGVGGGATELKNYNFIGLISDVKVCFERPKAYNPSPANGSSIDLLRSGVTGLSWTAGEYAVWHDIYFGTSQSEVTDANDFNILPGRGRKPLGQESYTFTEPLELGQTYYWRIDEVNSVNPAGPWRGKVWSFTVLGYSVIEDFETYTDYTTLHNTWKDGDTDFNSGAYLNLNEAGTPVRSGSKSAVMNLWTDSMPKAIVSRPIPVTAKDWASKGLAAMTLWFHGDPNNAYPTCYANPGDVSKLYVAIDNDADPSNAPKQYYDGDDTDLFVYDWHEWNAALSGFTGVALNNVVSFGIGVDVEPFAYNAAVTIDDIRLYQPRCVPLKKSMAGDFNSDCIVDAGDFEIMGNQWLAQGLGLVNATTPNASKLVLNYVFDDTGGSTITDVSGKGYNGTFLTDANGTEIDISGRIESDGVSQNSFHFMNATAAGLDTYTGISIPNNVFADNITTDATIALWIKNVHPGEAQDSGTHMFDSRTGTTTASRVLSVQSSSRNSTYSLVSNGRTVSYNTGSWEDQLDWTLYIFARDSQYMSVYADGIMVARGASSGTAMTAPARVFLGCAANRAAGDLDDGFTGNIDDFRIYSYSFSAGDALGLAGLTSYVYSVEEPPANATTDLYDDNVINFKDYALEAQKWLNEAMWP